MRIPLSFSGCIAALLLCRIGALSMNARLELPREASGLELLEESTLFFSPKIRFGLIEDVCSEVFGA
jgi:hypothetical protein